MFLETLQTNVNQQVDQILQLIDDIGKLQITPAALTEVLQSIIPITCDG